MYGKVKSWCVHITYTLACYGVLGGLLSFWVRMDRKPNRKAEDIFLLMKDIFEKNIILLNILWFYYLELS